jgi:hypothetical protein
VRPAAPLVCGPRCSPALQRHRRVVTTSVGSLHGNAPKMHLLFQVPCFIFCSGIIPYLNKTAESDAVFSKVSFLAILQEIKSGKNTTSVFHAKKESKHRRDMRECSRPKRTWPTCSDSLATWGLLVRPSNVASPPAFAYAFIYIEKGVTYETEAIHKIERRQSHDRRF